MSQMQLCQPVIMSGPAVDRVCNETSMCYCMAECSRFILGLRPPLNHSTKIVSTGNWALKCLRRETSVSPLEGVLALEKGIKRSKWFQDRFLPAHKTPYQSSCSCALLLQLRCGFLFCCCVPRISRHVRQRCQGPFRLRKGCQGHDGRQEGRQEEACVPVRPCRTAVSCRKDSQAFEGKRAQLSLEKLKQRLLAVLLRVQIFSKVQQASGCAYCKGQLLVILFRGVSLPTVE